MEDTQVDRIFSAIEGLRTDLSEFKEDFNKRMFIGNGTPAVMTSLKSHETAIEDLNVCIAKNNAALLREKENREKEVETIKKSIAPILEERDTAKKGMTFLKKHGKLLFMIFIIAVIITVLLVAGVIYVNSKIPEIREILTKLNGG